MIRRRTPLQRAHMTAKGPTARRRAAVVERDGGRCRACGWPGDHVHHVVYRSRGGGHDTSNLIVLCLRCHQLIHDKLLTVEGNANSGLIWKDLR